MPRRKSKKDIPDKMKAKDYKPRSIKSKQRTKVKRGKRGQRLTKKDILKPSNEPEFIQARPIIDIEAQRALRQDEETANQFRAGQLVYNQMINMVNESIKAGAGWGGKYLKQELESQINYYGFDTMMLMLATAPRDMIIVAQNVIRTSDRTEVETEIIHLRDLIEGAYADLETAKELEDEMEKDAFIEQGDEAGETEYPQQNYNNLPYND